MRFKSFLIALIVICQTSYAANAGNELTTILSKFNSYKANFRQVVTSGRKVIQKNRGQISILRPGKFRWQTRKPLAQLIVSDGKTLWIFDKDLEQVTIKSLDKEITGTPALFLSGYDKQITKEYQVSLKKSKQKQIFTLLPVDEKNAYKFIQLSYSNNVLVAMVLEDHLGQKTALQFSKIKLNPRLKKTAFSFKPPSGVDIIKE